jgi:ABC-type oligopeptide transport system substrate-binding subunit/class 3 adenylate cyclase
VPTTGEGQAARLNRAIAALEAQRTVLGDAVVDDSIAALRKELGELESGERFPEQKRKLVTMVYVDVVESTRIARRFDPEEVIEVVDTALKRLAKPVENYGGEVLRFMGDGFKAAFGVTEAHEDDPELAIRAGLDIITESHRIAEELEEKWHIPDFQVRVGINTGLVAIGGLTEGKYTVMGKAVNLTARLEKAAPQGGVLISHETYRHVRGIFKVTPQDPITAKGFIEPISVYIVEQVKPRAFYMPTRGVEGVETRMVGRESEFKRLQDGLSTALEEGEGHTITISGEAGVGKSRLLYEFDNWIELRPEVVYFFKGRGRHETQNVPFVLLRDVVAFRFQIQESDSPREVSKKLLAGFGEIFGHDDEARIKTFLIGQLLGFDLIDGSQPADSFDDPRQLRDRSVTYLVEYFLSLCQIFPLVIFLEDIQWADDSSLDVIDWLGNESRQLPLLIVCVTRTSLFERRPHWGEGKNYHTRLELQPLSMRESRRLVAEILKKMYQVPVALRELVVSGAEGNPFFIEELVKMLVERGVILKGEERWSVAAARLLEVEMPPSLVEILQARLDSLPPVERKVLQQASVIGRLFWDRAVMFLHESIANGHTEEHVTTALMALRDRELVYRREVSSFAGSNEYIFKHTLLRDVTYEGLVKTARQAFHGQVAKWLMAQSGERVEEYTGLIAGHLELAGQSKQAAQYLIHAGDKARAVYALKEAERFYKQSIDILRQHGEDEQTANTLMKLGLVYTADFDPDKADQAYREAFALRQEKTFDAIDTRPAENILRLALEEPDTLDPGRIYIEIAIFLAAQLFEGLVRIGEDYNVLPALAERWEISEGGTAYRFYLRDNAYWSEGSRVTALDFESTWKRNLDPNFDSPSANLLYPLKNARAFHQKALDDPSSVGVKALSESILEIRLENPSAYLPYLLGHPVAYPQPHWLLGQSAALWTDPDTFVTNGPFRVSLYQSGSLMKLERNPYYQSSFPGNVQAIEGLIFDDYNSALDAYAQDQVDVVSLLNADPGTIILARERYPSQLIDIPRSSTLFVSFNCKGSPFDDIRLRKAFVHAIDREAMVERVFQGLRLPATGGFVPPGMPSHSPGIGLSFEPETAQNLLEAAGYPGGEGFPEVTLVFSGSGGENLIQFLKDSWGQILGLEINLVSVEWVKFWERLDQNPPHLVMTGWGADYPDPDNMLRPLFHSNEGVFHPRWQNKQFDRLIEQAGSVLDQERRVALYQDADRILVRDEAVVMPLSYNQARMLVKPWVKLRPPPSVSMPLHVLTIENT